MIGKVHCEPFDAKHVFRPVDFFNFLGKILRPFICTTFCKSARLLAYADYINLIDLSSAFSRLDKEAQRLGVVVNEVKAKCLLPSNKQSGGCNPCTYAAINSHNFDFEYNFVILTPRVMSALKSNAGRILPTNPTLDWVGD